MIPKPFRRPGIEIGSRSLRRWADVAAKDISTGDVIPDLGKVVRSSSSFSGHVILTFMSGEFVCCDPDQTFHAFSEGADVGIRE